MTTDQPAVDYRFADGAAWITLTATEAGNPLTVPMGAQLHEAVQRARRDDARVVVLRAEGHAFCVGGDVRTFHASPDRRGAVEDMAEGMHRIVSDLHHLDAVVVCAVQGVAAGAGVPLAAAADLVLAGESARFTLAYTRIGFSPDGGSTLLWASLGLHRTLHLALLNPLLTAEQAQSLGLVCEVHPDAELGAATERMVTTLLAGSRTAQVAAKRLVRGAAVPSAESAMRREALSIARCAAEPDGLEGVEAFLDKRRPVFPSATS